MPVPGAFLVQGTCGVQPRVARRDPGLAFHGPRVARTASLARHGHGTRWSRRHVCSFCDHAIKRRGSYAHAEGPGTICADFERGFPDLG
jgi:hypothetical protein